MQNLRVRRNEFIHNVSGIKSMFATKLSNVSLNRTKQRSPAPGRRDRGGRRMLKTSRRVVRPTSGAHHAITGITRRTRTTNRSTTATMFTRIVVVVVRSVVRTRRDILRFVRDLYNCTVCLGQGAGRHVYSILSILDRCTPFRLHEFSRAPSSHSRL